MPWERGAVGKLSSNGHALLRSPDRRIMAVTRNSAKSKQDVAINVRRIFGGTRVTVTRRSWAKAGCAEHCAEKHQLIQSFSVPWPVSRARATALLLNVRPYLRLQLEDAVAALNVALSAPSNPATVAEMHQLGWDTPWEAP